MNYTASQNFTYCFHCQQIYYISKREHTFVPLETLDKVNNGVLHIVIPSVSSLVKLNSVHGNLCEMFLKYSLLVHIMFIYVFNTKFKTYQLKNFLYLLSIKKIVQLIIVSWSVLITLLGFPVIFSPEQVDE